MKNPASLAIQEVSVKSTSNNSTQNEAANLSTGPVKSQYPSWPANDDSYPFDATRRVFCNRSLNMNSITAVGFDMDYTLAQYKEESFQKLAYYSTIDKLVTNFGYPEEIQDFMFDWRYMTRGLTVDKKRGNILKIDRHKYVKLAFHGFKPLKREERLQTYCISENRLSFEEPDYSMLDTFFSLAEAQLFMQLVELKDTLDSQFLQKKEYIDIYRDSRAAVDLCHRDGTLNREVAADPGKYIHKDPQLTELLTLLRDSGRSLFLATNSLWDYTNVVMNYLVTERVGVERNEEWLEYFDVVITGCNKPAFFTQKKSLFQVVTDIGSNSGMLINTDNGAPIIPISDQDLPFLNMASSADELELENHLEGQKAIVFQGGYYIDLHKMLGVKSGTEVLYCGDHIYGDILRSKKTLGWRTVLIVPELDQELTVSNKYKSYTLELQALRVSQDALDDQIQRFEWQLRCEEESDQESLEVVQNLKGQLHEVKVKYKSILKTYHQRFHKVWGQLLKTGNQNSFFAHQMERFACLYTSHVSNLLLYSPYNMYEAPVDYMTHEVESIWGNSDGK